MTNPVKKSSEVRSHLVKSEGDIYVSSKRDENSLYTLTKRFVHLIYTSPEQQINITQAADILLVGKRRIYDITNVLEGLGMISKWSVNSVKWIGGNIDDIISNEDTCSESQNLKTNNEKEIDREIERLENEINIITSDQKNLENAYVTYDDLQKLAIFNNKLVFAVKAPGDTTIEYPRYQKGAYRLKLMVERGQISVYYVNDDNDKE